MHMSGTAVTARWSSHLHANWTPRVKKLHMGGGEGQVGGDGWFQLASAVMPGRKITSSVRHP